MPVVQCSQPGCAHLHFESPNQVHILEIPLISTLQNLREYFSSTIAVSELIKHAEIPALDFSLMLEDYCAYTVAQIGTVTAGGVPPLWQRVTDSRRIQNIRNWLGNPGNNSMPDGVLLGIKDHHLIEVNQNNMVVVGGRSIYTGTITQTLFDTCPMHPNFQDAAGNAVYRNRCFTHGCPSHDVSSSPITIIDGQHRVMGIHQSALPDDNNDVACSMLLEITPTAGFDGYDIGEKARVFSRVNSEAQKLNDLHSIWLKRMFTDWRPVALVNDKKLSYDLLARLGTNPGTWRGTVRMHPTSIGDPRIDNAAFAVGELTGKILGLGPMEQAYPSAAAAAARSGTIIDVIIDNWLASSVANWPAMFTLPVAESVFDVGRLFAAYVRTLHEIIALVDAHPSFSTAYTIADFDNILSAYNPCFATTVSWDNYISGGEPPQRNMYNILRTMFEALETGPTWLTHAGPALPGAPIISWDGWATIPPDPIDDFNIVTQLIGGNHPGGTSIDAGNSRAIVGVATTLEWSRPRNIMEHGKLYWRLPAGGWSQIVGKKGGAVAAHCDPNRDSELDLSDAGNLTNTLNGLPPGSDWDFMITYENMNGVRSDVQIGFTTP